MTRTDDDLAGLVAGDLERHLAMVDVSGPVFGIALWIDEGYGAVNGTPDYGVSIGTDADLAFLADRRVSDEQWYRWPTSERWSSGNWSHLVVDFLEPATELALEPLRELVRTPGRPDRRRVVRPLLALLVYDSGSPPVA